MIARVPGAAKGCKIIAFLMVGNYIGKMMKRKKYYLSQGIQDYSMSSIYIITEFPFNLVRLFLDCLPLHLK